MFNLEEYNKTVEVKDTLGVQICWSMHKMRVDLDNLKKKMTKVGLSHEFIPSENAKAKFKAAVKAVAKATPDIYDVIAVTDNAEKHSYRFVIKTVDKETEKVVFSQETMVTFDKGTGTITGEGDNQIVKEVSRLNADYQHNISDDKIRNMFTWLLKEENGATNYRPNGGVYFLEKRDALVASQITELTAYLGLGNVKVLRIPNLKVNREAVALADSEDTCSGVEELIKLMKEATPRASTVEKWIEQLLAKKVKKEDLYLNVLKDLEEWAKVKTVIEKGLDLAYEIQKEIAEAA